MSFCTKISFIKLGLRFCMVLQTSTEYAQIINLAKPLIEEFQVRAIDLMSIGAGTGCLENDLIKLNHLNLNSFLAIEPNAHQLEKLKQTVASWGMANIQMDPRSFDETYETCKRFDIILMSHSMYCMENPLAVILKARSLLKRGGKLIIFIQTEEGGHEIYTRMMQEVTMQHPINDHFVTSKSISEALEKNGIKHDVKIGQSHIDVTDFIERNSTPTFDDNITFLLQSDYSGLKEDLQKSIYEIVRERTILAENGKYMFSHPTGMVIAYNGQKGWRS